jgi:hypothetical protein
MLNVFRSLKERQILFLIVLVAFALRVSFAVYSALHIPENTWAFGYEPGSIARSIAVGDGFSSPFREPSGPTAWMMPLYPCLLALVFKLFGVYSFNAALAIFTLNSVFSALTCIPLYRIAKSCFGRIVGYVAAISLAVYPVALFHVGHIWETSLFTLLATCLLAWLLSLPKAFNFKSAFLYGAFNGFVALVNPVIIAFCPFAAIWLFAQSNAPKKQRLRQIGTMFIAMILTLMPWIVRNYTVFGQVMLRSNFGLELRLGNSPEAWSADKARRMAPWSLGHPATSQEEFLRYASLGEVEYMNRALNDAVAFIRENPEKFLWLSLQRIEHFWFNEFSGKDESKKKLGLSFSIAGIAQIIYILPVPFMLWGIVLALQRKIGVAPLIFFILSIPAVYYVTHAGLTRYRYPVEPMIILFASFGFSSLFLMVRRRIFAQYKLSGLAVET